MSKETGFPLILWLLHNLIPKGSPGMSLPLWPGKLAVAFLFLAVAFAFLVWLLIARAQPNGRRSAALAALSLACFGLADWALLVALPRLGLSFGPLTFPLIAITAVRLVAFLIIATPLYLWSRMHSPGGLTRQRSENWIRKLLNAGLICLWLANLGLLALELYGLYIEPFDLRTTEVSLSGPPKASGAPLRILHLSDLHVERITRRERQLIERAKALQPDLILLTGDYTNIDYLEDPHTLRDVRIVLAQLSAPYGVYAVAGSVDTPRILEEVFTGLAITLLKDEARLLKIGEQDIYLLGVSNLRTARDAGALRNLMKNAPPDAYSILLYHTPDLIEVADQLKVDLYLAGHTHGGQVRLPFWGAVITMSAYGKQYESGLYQLKSTTMYVSRGLGMEGLSMPRARFLCPPEIILFYLRNEVSQ